MNDKSASVFDACYHSQHKGKLVILHSVSKK